MLQVNQKVRDKRQTNKFMVTISLVATPLVVIDKKITANSVCFYERSKKIYR